MRTSVTRALRRVEREVHAAELHAEVRHRDDRHVVDDVRDRAVRVARDDRLQRAARQLAHEPEDLAAVVARAAGRADSRSRRTSRRRASRARRSRRRARAARAPRARRSRRAGSSRAPATCAASVCRKPVSVIMPMRPTRTPAASTIADGATFGQCTGLPVAASTMFAARNGKRARAAAAFSAPCRSLGVGAADRAAATTPRPARADRRSRSRSRDCRWRAPCSRSRCRRRRP